MRFCANAVGIVMATRRRAGMRSRFMMLPNLSAPASLGNVFRPFVANCHGGVTRARIVCVEVRMKQLRELGAVLVLAAAIFSPVIIAAQAPSQPPGGLPDLVGMLKATPGVLG